MGFGIEKDRHAIDDPLLLQLIRQIHESQLALDRKLTDHIALEPIEFGEKLANMMQKAFPEGDPEGHRRHHELVIQREEERVEFWRAMRKEIGKWGIISVLGLLIVSAWHSFLQGPQR